MDPNLRMPSHGFRRSEAASLAEIRHSETNQWYEIKVNIYTHRFHHLVLSICLQLLVCGMHQQYTSVQSPFLNNPEMPPS